MTFERLLARVSLDSPSPAVKQAPTIFGFALAVVLVLVPGTVATITNVTGFVVAIVLMLVASFLALVVPWRRLPAEAAIAVPVISLAAVGFLRISTGGSASPFNVLVLLPFVWIATEEGRINALIAAVGTFVVLIAPIVPFDGSSTRADVVRAFYAPVIYLIVAFVVNEIAHRVRQQLAAAEAASEQRKELLDQAVRASDELALNEARLKTANRLILSIWNAITEQSVIGTDLDGLIDVWNPGAEKMLGLTQEQVTAAGRHVVDFHLTSELAERLHELDERKVTMSSPGEFSALVDAVRAGYAEARDWTYVRADGKRVPVQVTATPRLDENGHRVGFIFVATDMTQAREFARLKDEFVGLISHELRTPLSSILGYLELMRDDEDAPLSAEQLQYLGIAERNAHRLLRLVGDLLFTAQVESGQFPLDLREVDLRDVVGASIESATPAADSAGIDLVARLDDAPLLIRGDAQRIGQAVDNLVSNAIKFTPARGTITVGVERDDTEACITVSDSGMGIPAVELGQLSTRFFRASTATRNAVPGVGLGLTITKAIVTAHGGRMTIESEEGVGTSFTVRLPLEGSDRNAR